MASPMSQYEFHRTITLHTQWAKIPYPTASFAGQTIIITGSNSGVGLEAARHIVRLGAEKVILAVRDVSKGEVAAADILTTTKATRNVIQVWPLDLSNVESIKAFTAKLNQLDKVDAVLQNAGIAGGPFRRTNSGEELTIGTNTIGTVLLGLLVLPKLRESAKKFGTRTRLAFTGSESYMFASFQEANLPGPLLETLRDEKIFRANMHDRYMTSKLLLLHAVREVAARSPITPESNVTITIVTPGLCWSGLFRELPWILFPLYFIIMTIVARSAEVGSRILVDALRPDLGIEAHGAFLLDRKPRLELGESIESERAKEVAKKFTTELFERLEELSPGVSSVLG